MDKLSSLLHIGAEEKSIKVVGEIILSILNTTNDQATKIAAIGAIEKASSVNNTAVTGCYFTGSGDLVKKVENPMEESPDD